MNARGDWMQTRTGKAFYPKDPRPEEICIDDIAWGLSNDCRFAGQCQFYCTALHSYLVSFLCEPRFALQGLLHDAPEAYLRDIPRPVKLLLPDYKALERRVAVAIGARFSVELVDMHPSVHTADLKMLALERRILMGPPPMPWIRLEASVTAEADEILRDRPEVLRALMLRTSPERARELFLQRFDELGGAL